MLKLNKCIKCGGDDIMIWPETNGFAILGRTAICKNCKNCELRRWPFSKEGAAIIWNFNNPESKEEDKP